MPDPIEELCCHEPFTLYTKACVLQSYSSPRPSDVNVFCRFEYLDSLVVRMTTPLSKLFTEQPQPQWRGQANADRNEGQ